MSQHIEWEHATNTSIDWFARGDTLDGYDIPIEADFGVLLGGGGGGALMIEGSRDELLELVEILLASVKALPKSSYK